VAIDEVDRRIVAAICELAASLHLAVVGEGVETVEASRRLAEAGCHFQQGFLYHCPAPAADTTATLARAWSGAVSVPEEFADSDRRSS
jgi:EAL domain-containing protein (putative c-di-GMP-specific phosphodiesterase class I)